MAAVWQSRQSDDCT